MKGAAASAVGSVLNVRNSSQTMTPARNVACIESIVNQRRALLRPSHHARIDSPTTVVSATAITSALTLRSPRPDKTSPTGVPGCSIMDRPIRIVVESPASDNRTLRTAGADLTSNARTSAVEAMMLKAVKKTSAMGFSSARGNAIDRTHGTIKQAWAAARTARSAAWRGPAGASEARKILSRIEDAVFALAASATCPIYFSLHGYMIRLHILHRWRLVVGGDQHHAPACIAELRNCAENRRRIQRRDHDERRPPPHARRFAQQEGIERRDDVVGDGRQRFEHMPELIGRAVGRYVDRLSGQRRAAVRRHADRVAALGAFVCDRGAPLDRVLKPFWVNALPGVWKGGDVQANHDRRAHRVLVHTRLQRAVARRGFPVDVAHRVAGLVVAHAHRARWIFEDALMRALLAEQVFGRYAQLREPDHLRIHDQPGTPILSAHRFEQDRKS